LELLVPSERRQGCTQRRVSSGKFVHPRRKVDLILSDDAAPLALRPREAAKALGVSERTLWAWTKEGDVPHAKIGGTLLYPVAELREWLSRKVAAAGGSGE
jgi:excisionase family DNA binding protein